MRHQKEIRNLLIVILISISFESQIHSQFGNEPDFSSMNKNNLYVEAGSLFLVLFQAEICYERNILSKEISIFNDKFNFYYTLHVKPALGTQVANPIFDTNYGNSYAFTLVNQFPSFWADKELKGTKGFEIGLIYYKFYNGDFFEGNDILPVIYYTQRIYHDDFFVKFSFGVPNSAGIGLGINF